MSPVAYIGLTGLEGPYKGSPVSKKIRQYTDLSQEYLDQAAQDFFTKVLEIYKKRLTRQSTTTWRPVGTELDSGARFVLPASVMSRSEANNIAQRVQGKSTKSATANKGKMKGPSTGKGGGAARARLGRLMHSLMYPQPAYTAPQRPAFDQYGDGETPPHLRR